MERRPLRDVLNDEDYWARRFAISSASKSRDVDVLVRGLTDPDHRSVAAEALGDIQAEEAVTPLLRLLDASDSDVRSAAARALGKIGSTDALERLLEVAERDKEWAVRTWAIAALGSIGDSAVAPRLVPLLDDANADVRTSAALALGQIGDPSATDDLLRVRATEPRRRRRHYTKALRALRRKRDSH